MAGMQDGAFLHVLFDATPLPDAGGIHQDQALPGILKGVSMLSRVVPGTSPLSPSPRRG